MPTSQQIEVVLDEISELLISVGEEVDEIQGPIQMEENGGSAYYLFAESEGSRFYISASTEAYMMGITYPYNISKHVGRLLERNQIENILEKEDVIDGKTSFEEITEEELQLVAGKAGEKIISNTKNGIISEARFNIAAYGSSDLVDLRFDGRCDQFRTIRTLYPYETGPTLENVHTRVMSAISMGKRARRYIETSFSINQSGDKLTLELTV